MTVTIQSSRRSAALSHRMAAEGGDALILPDNVHPNAAGHGKIAAIFADATRH